ncbi:thioredoxin [archaeon]|nr:thioredoxin [archaeon]NCP79624.1 thioredoxin [archaeon]NCP98305.1 thioredoxin [archaeon]NCQ07391.1 thioredoxin [archaeon]NCQ51187.1 thioredoxin [archaeon]
MSENVTELNDTNFKETITGKEIVVVDFWAAWCGPCQMFASIFENFAKENTNVFCVKVNVDDSPNISKEYQVMSIPTILFIKNGEVVKKQVGVLSKEIIKQIVNEL